LDEADEADDDDDGLSAAMLRASERALERERVRAECVEVTITKGLLGMSMLKRPPDRLYGMMFSHFTGMAGVAEKQAAGRLAKGMVLTSVSEEEIRGLNFKETKQRLKHRPITLTFQPAFNADNEQEEEEEEEEEEGGCVSSRLTTSKARLDDASMASSCYSEFSTGRDADGSTFSEYGEAWKSGMDDALLG
jgi:hypothetical protein